MSGVSRFSGQWRHTTAANEPTSQLFDRRRATQAPEPDQSLNERLSQLFTADSVERLATRIAEFKRSISQSLEKSSQAYQILLQLTDSNLKDCARCTKELEARLVSNPHYIVIQKLEEAERQIARLDSQRR